MVNWPLVEKFSVKSPGGSKKEYHSEKHKQKYTDLVKLKAGIGKVAFGGASSSASKSDDTKYFAVPFGGQHEVETKERHE
jgi:hypothetical protein